MLDLDGSRSDFSYKAPKPSSWCRRFADSLLTQNTETRSPKPFDTDVAQAITGLPHLKSIRENGSVQIIVRWRCADLRAEVARLLVG
jgi:hypothetical protein